MLAGRCQPISTDRMPGPRSFRMTSYPVGRRERTGRPAGHHHVNLFRRRELRNHGVGVRRRLLEPEILGGPGARRDQPSSVKVLACPGSTTSVDAVRVAFRMAEGRHRHLAGSAAANVDHQQSQRGRWWRWRESRVRRRRTARRVRGCAQRSVDEDAGAEKRVNGAPPWKFELGIARALGCGQHDGRANAPRSTLNRPGLYSAAMNAWHDVELGDHIERYFRAVIEIPKGSKIK
jgi:hypothetical protein